MFGVRSNPPPFIRRKVESALTIEHGYKKFGDPGTSPQKDLSPSERYCLPQELLAP